MTTIQYLNFQGLLSVVIPVYNEKKTIEAILKAVSEVPVKKEIIAVDDHSNDGTTETLRRLESNWRERLGDKYLDSLRIKFHDQNKGKGAALRTGFAEVSGEIVIIQDADLEYDPNDYFKLIEPIVNDGADVVYGSRFVGSEKHRVHLFWHYVGNRALTFFSNMLNNLNLTDMETGYKAFKSEVIKKMRISSNRFGIEPELTAKFARMKCCIYEVAVTYRGRSYAEGKKITWRDGIAAFWHILKYRWAD